MCSVQSVTVLLMAFVDNGGVSLGTPMVCSRYSCKHFVNPHSWQHSKHIIS